MPMIAIVIARNPPATPAINPVMLSERPRKPLSDWALVLDSEKEKKKEISKM